MCIRDRIEGALVVSVSTDNISLNMSYLTQIAVTVAIIAGAVVLFFGVLVLLHLFVPIKKLSDEISDIKDGFGKEQLDVDCLLYTSHHGDHINLL